MVGHDNHSAELLGRVAVLVGDGYLVETQRALVSPRFEKWRGLVCEYWLFGRRLRGGVSGTRLLVDD